MPYFLRGPRVAMSRAWKIFIAAAALLAGAAIFSQSGRPRSRPLPPRQATELPADARAPGEAPVPSKAPAAPPRKAARRSFQTNPLDRVAPGITAAPSGGPASLVVRDAKVNAFFTPKGVTLAALGRLSPGSGPSDERAVGVHWGLVGAAQVQPRPEGERPERVHRYVGDPSTWTPDQKSFSSVVYEEIRPGVDLVVESRPHALKYTLQAAPGADLRALRFRYAGARDVEILEGGTAVDVTTDVGTIREDGLHCFQEGPGGRHEVPARYAAAGPGEVEIVLGAYDPELPLTIDPVIGWSSFLGGAVSPQGDDYGYSVAADGSGNVYVAGYTYCLDFPGVAGGLSSTLKGSLDGFLIKLAADGTSILWATYLGGLAGPDYAYGVAVDASGNPYVVGNTNSSDFPTTAGAYDTLFNFYDAFVMKFNASGTLAWSTFLGGTSTEYGEAIALDGSGNVYVGGYTYSSNFPIVGGFDATVGTTPDGYVAKLNPTGTSLLWSSYLGGNDTDYVKGVAVDPSGNVYLAGYTYSSDFPTTGGIDTVRGGTVDAFLTKVNATGASLAWSTYLGGASSDYAYGVTVTTDATPEPVVVGYTFSSDFPTTATAYDKTYSSQEAFVTRVASTGLAYVYSTFLGGTSSDYGYAVTPGPSGSVFVTGYTYSTNFPTTAGAYRTTSLTTPDGFVTQVNSAGTGLTASTYLAGNASDTPRGIFVVPSGAGAGIYVTGDTMSTDFPSPAPPRLDAALGGSRDAFVVKLPLTLAGADWASYLGGTQSLGDDWGYDVAIDPSQANTLFVVGYTNTLDFPTTAGLDTTLGGSQDVFVTKVSTSGTTPSIVWSTYLGGVGMDNAYGCAADSTGRPYVVGYTSSSDFPLLSAADSTFSSSEAFVTRLTTTGTLSYSTFLGGSSSDYGRAIAVDGTGNAYVTGYTYSSDFPTNSAFDSTLSTSPDAFVAKLSSSGSLSYSSYVGGDNYDQGNGIACDSAGNVVVVGYTQSTDFAGSSGPDFTLGGTVDAFAVRVDSGGSRIWRRYLGGTNSEYGQAAAANASGSAVYVVGYTYSTDFPTLLPYDGTLTTSPDAFVTKLDPATGNLVWSTYLGGSSIDYAYAVEADAAGNAYVTGYTYSSDFPTKNPFDSTWNGSADVYVTKIYASGTSLGWSSFLGGTQNDYGNGITVDSAGVVYVTGYTYSPDFPALNPLDGTMSGNHDGFIVRLDNSNPDDPNFFAPGTGQFRMDDSFLGVGAWTNGSDIKVKARLDEDDDETVKLQVEIQPIGIDFTGATVYESAFVAAGTIAIATVPLSLGGPSEYHWRARAVDVNGRMSAWVSFGGNPDAPLPAARDVGRDLASPGVSITSPVGPTFYTTSASIALSGTSADDASGVTGLTWANTTTGATGPAVGVASWSVASVGLNAGANLIEVRAADGAGNQGVATVTVNRDNTPPAVTITTPAADPFVTGSGSVSMSGDASDTALLASVSWVNNRGGSGVGTLGPGTWSATVAGLSPGLNVITVTATDAAGNIATAQRTLNYDNVPPTVAISSPPQGATTDLASITLTGTSGDNILVSSVGWTRVSPPGASGTASGTTGWTATGVPLAAGANTIQIQATDSVGLTAVASITVYLDTALPVVAITLPTSSPTFITGSSTVSLGGTATDDIGVQSIAWARQAPPGTPLDSGTGTLADPGAPSSSWSIASIPLLGSNDNQITVTLTDKVGRTHSDVITVFFDTTAPSIVVTSPATTPFVTNSSTLLISGSVSDNAQVVSMGCVNTTTSSSFAVTTTPALVPGPVTSATWSATVTLAVGTNVVSIEATDNIPTTTSVTITLIFDATLPTVAITGPTSADDHHTGTATLTLAGTAADNRGVTQVTWSTTAAVVPASGTAVGTASWSVASIGLVTGTQTIAVTARDEALNTVTDTLLVTYDPTLPDITITSPTAAGTFFTTAASLPLGGTASDNALLQSVTWTNAATGASGTATGTTTWSVASVALNGGQNTLSVTARDYAGNVRADTIVISRDTAAPTVTITGPTSLLTHTTNVGTVALAGTAADDVEIAGVQWANAATGASGTATGTASWSQTAVSLNAGNNLITVTVTDRVNQTSTDTITVHYDPNAPSIAITTPAPPGPYSTTGTPYALAGTASDLDGSGASAAVAQATWRNVTTGGTGTATLTSGTWSASVPLTSGSNTLQMTALDAAGNSTTTSVSVTYDPAAPFITITTPTTGLTYATGATPAVLGGTASDDVGVVSVGWSTTAAVVPNSGSATGTTTWSASVPLAAGSNLITITATDGVGRTGTSRITLIYDPTPPAVAITNPTAEANFLTTFSPFALGGAAADNLEVQSVAWTNLSTGDSGYATGLGTWSVNSLVLTQGLNVIEVTATDGVGNTGTATVNVTYDGAPPAVAIATPTAAPTYATSTRPLPIGGSATDNLQVATVTWVNSLGGGGPATLGGPPTNRTWSASVYLLPGSNLITVTATDGHGQTATDTLTVTFTPESVAPGILITGPTGTGSATSAAQTVALSGSADDNVSVVSVRWRNQTTGVRGTAVLSGGPNPISWSADVPLADGTNVVVVTAVDDAGNQSSATITVTYAAPADVTTPSLTITGPTILDVWDASTSPLLLTCAATDNVGITSVRWSNPSTGGAGVATLLAGSTWTVSVGLAVGANTVTLTARDPAGNSAVDVLIVNFVPPPGDLIAPTVSITSHPTGTTLALDVPSVDLGGTSSDNQAVATVVWINAATSTSATAEGVDVWTGSVSLAPGINVITVRAFDTSGNTDTEQITALYTPPPPPPEPPVYVPAGHTKSCGSTGIDLLLPLALLWLGRRGGCPARRRSRR